MSAEPPPPDPAAPPPPDPAAPPPGPAARTPEVAPPIQPPTSGSLWRYPAGQDSRMATLALYLETNRGSFTDEALAARATEAGYTHAEINEAGQLLRSVEAAKPVRIRARQVVLAAYLVTYAALVAGMLLNPQTYGAAPIGIAVLTLVLGVAIAISLALVRSSRPRADSGLALAGVVAVPVILLVVVAGLCVATGLPIPRAVEAGQGTAPVDGEQPPAPAES